MFGSQCSNNQVYLQPVVVCPILIQTWGSWSSSTRLQGSLTSSQERANSKDTGNLWALFWAQITSGGLLGQTCTWNPLGAPVNPDYDLFPLAPQLHSTFQGREAYESTWGPLCMWARAGGTSTAFVFSFDKLRPHLWVLQLFLVSKGVIVVFFCKFYPRGNLLLSYPSSTRWTVGNQGEVLD